MAAAVLAHADETPDKIALSVVSLSKSQRWSYARLKSAVLAAGTGFLQAGLSAGDRIMLRLDNTPDFPIAFLGAIAVGMIPIPTSPQLTAPEITKLATKTNPKLIIVGSAQIALPNGDWPVIDVTTFRTWEDLPEADIVLGDPDRPAYIIFTSGTGGTPHTVVHAHRAIWARRMMWRGWYDLKQSDRILHAGAFNWTFTLGTGLMDPWSIGATALIPAPGIAPPELPLLLKRHDATLFAAAPGVYRQMLRGTFPTLPKLRHGLSAGEKMHEKTRQAWINATGTAVHEAYGMSECSTFISGSPDRPAPSGSLGYAQDGRRISIRESGKAVPLNEHGMIAVHRSDPGLMIGYLDDEEAMNDKFEGEWFLTGDLGVMGEDGAITYAGRADDMMNAGGFRVSPLEVENAMLEHAAISEVAACEITVNDGVGIIGLFYKAHKAIDSAELEEFARTRLARYKVPRAYIAVDQLPRGTNNKLLRRKLRQDWESQNGQT